MASLGACEVELAELSTLRGLTLSLRLPMQQLFAADSLVRAAEQARLKGRILRVELHSVNKKRTLDQNAYMWALMTRIAEVLGSTAEEIYEIMLERYGVKTYQALPESELKALDLYNCRELGRRVIDGVEYVSYVGTIGSSKYDTAQMGRLLDGIISECQELEIDTYVEGWDG